MNRERSVVPMMHVPSPEDSERSAREARAMFARTLALWASDVLSVRREAMDRFTWHSPRRLARWSKAA